MQDKQKELERLLINVTEQGADDRIKKCKAKLNELSVREEILWRQRAKTTWLREGDRNSRYFHAFALARKRHNKVQRIKNSTSEWCKDSMMSSVFMQYFVEIFTFAESSNGASHIFNLITKKISSELQNVISKHFTRVEVKIAAFQIDPNNAPGPNGMTACFYQKYWHVVGPKITNSILGFLNGEDDLDAINHTSEVLIPKKKNLEVPSDFRPISLCSILYKIIGACE